MSLCIERERLIWPRDASSAIVSDIWLTQLKKASEKLNDAIQDKCTLIALRILAAPFLCIPTSLALTADLLLHIILITTFPLYCACVSDSLSPYLTWMICILTLHLLTLGILSLIPILLKLENPLTESRIEKMTPDQVSCISSQSKTYTTTVNGSSISITLAPTPLETVIASKQYWSDSTYMLIDKSREKNRLIPVTISQTRQEETTQMDSTITPLEFAFLMGSSINKTLIQKGAQLSLNPLPLVHSAILTHFSFLFHLDFTLDYLKKMDTSIESFSDLGITHISAYELPWSITSSYEKNKIHFKPTLLISALRYHGYAHHHLHKPLRVELFERLFVLGADFHQESTDGERVTLSENLINKFEGLVKSTLKIDKRRQAFQYYMNRYRINSESVSEEIFQTAQNAMHTVSKSDDCLASTEETIDQVFFQGFLGFHRRLVIVVKASEVLPIEVSHLICEYITNINNALLSKYEILNHPLRKISFVLSECIPCLIVSEYLEEADYSSQIEIRKIINPLLPYDAFKVQTFQRFLNASYLEKI